MCYIWVFFVVDFCGWFYLWGNVEIGFVYIGGILEIDFVFVGNRRDKFYLLWVVLKVSFIFRGWGNYRDRLGLVGDYRDSFYYLDFSDRFYLILGFKDRFYLLGMVLEMNFIYY